MWKNLTYSLFAFLLLVAVSTASAQQPTARVAEKELVKVYPNPVVSEATIGISRDLDLERSRVSVTFYNIVGKEVLQINNVKDYQLRITREAFLPGLYIYQMKVDDKVQSTGRISFK